MPKTSKTFSLFTPYTYYGTSDGNLEKISITKTSQKKDKSRIDSISNVSQVIAHSIDISNHNVTTAYTVSDGMSSQLRYRYGFHLLTTIHISISLEWHLKETHEIMSYELFPASDKWSQGVCDFCQWNCANWVTLTSRWGSAEGTRRGEKRNTNFWNPQSAQSGAWKERVWGILQQVFLIERRW